MPLDLTHRHAAHVEAQNHIVEAVEPGLAFGTYSVTQGFVPLLTSSRGAIVNNVSMMAPRPLADHSGLRDLEGRRVST